MQQQLEVQHRAGPTKLETFATICPRWFAKLTGGFEDESLSITDDKTCIAGEAHGLSDKYVISETPCGECFDLSLGLVSVAERYAEFPGTKAQVNNDHIVKEFVDHWNKFHA